jgi:hypothetical protein
MESKRKGKFRGGSSWSQFGHKIPGRYQAEATANLWLFSGIMFEGLIVRNDEVVGSIPTSSTIFSIT